ncbi:ABC transporter ATP-binding protein/permease [Planktomarina sp.]|nr:ABC transporter ATP-binding protein [Planktomarina sp.]MDA9100217.1 ABC transporter ATP-binding protein/permease [Planktomarina sp.]MDB4051459.1 ABC transporter ATP-binding protein/permease [Planktomarina sp.]
MKPSNWIDHMAPADGPPPITLRGFFYWSLRGSFKVLALSGFTSILTGITEVSAVLMLGMLVDAALASSSQSPLGDHLWLFGAGVLFFLVLRPIFFGIFSFMQTNVVTPNVSNLVLSRLHRWTLGQSVQFFDNDFAGRIAQKEMQTARAVTDVVVEILHTVLFALASVIGAALMLTSVDVSLTVGLCLWLLTYLALIKYFMPLIRKRSGVRASARAMVTGQIVDTVTNIKTVKLFAHDEHEDQAALEAMRGFRDSSLDYGTVASWFRFCLNSLGGILPVMMVGGSLWFWSTGSISAGDIAVAGAISLRLSQMTGWVSYTLMTIYANLGEIEDGISTLSPPHDLTDAPDAKRLRVPSGKIDFDRIHFAYGRDVGGVDNISLSIAAGEKVGVVGASGAGKSTLVSLLLRLYDAEKGTVRIDGQDLRKVTQESLRHQIGMVTQETALFNRSARDNILYGRATASEAELVDAAKQAEAHNFILQLQDHKGRRGYEAHLGEQGVKLSGGQRQRIALARAILKDAPILVLDEATSALDSEVESSIQSALERVMRGKTVLAIAHRLSTLSKMDRIIIIDQGHIVETGTHQSLLELGGLYHRYWKRQSGGFIETQQAAE